MTKMIHWIKTLWLKFKNLFAKNKSISTIEKSGDSVLRSTDVSTINAVVPVEPHFLDCKTHIHDKSGLTEQQKKDLNRGLN